MFDAVFGVHAGLQHTTADELRSVWRRIEDLGYGWISVWDHFYGATGHPDDAACLEAVAMHAALACSTERVRVGSLVYSIGYRHPAVLAKAIMVAEPWDPGPGGYQLGRFGKEFQEHNDTYRDEVRSFWRGEPGKVGALAGKIAGSAEIFNFAGRKPSAGVNMLAVHDGFTLQDLVSFNDKHNEANGENNRDGHSNNQSWNGGVEGPTDDAKIIAARKRDVRALLATLFLSRGTPLIQQGDEMGRTQHGNNNAYAQDNEITWVDWENADGALVDFAAAAYRFRKSHPALTHDHFLTGQDKNGIRDVVWLHPDGREMTDGDWNDAGASVLGMRLQVPNEDLIVWFNRRMDPVLARLPEGYWQIGLASDDTAVVPLADGAVTLPPRSVVALVKGHIPSSQPDNTPPAYPQEMPVEPETPQPAPEPDQAPGNTPTEVPQQEPPETTPRE